MKEIKIRFSKRDGQNMGALLEAMEVGKQFKEGLITDEGRKQRLADICEKYEIPTEAQP